MKIAVAGTGYVGLSLAVLLSQKNEVVALDIVKEKVNMINNLGNAAAESTHFAGSLQCMPRNLRKMFTMKRFEIDFPLKHPAEVGENTDYKKRLYKRNAWGHPWIKIRYSMEELLLNLRYGNMKFIHNAVINRLRIFVKGKKYY